MRFHILALLAAITLALIPQSSRSQTPALLDTTIAAGESDAQQPARKRGLNVDFATYAQDDLSEQQVDADPDYGLRDARLIFKGKFKTKRPLIWTMGIM